jgi:2-phosphoglycerate kinase
MSESRQSFENVFWLGGSPCAGKSSISRVLADRFNLELYHVDETLERRSQYLDPALQPSLIKWHSSSWNERWMKPIEILLQEAIACYEEHFALILEEIRCMPKHKPLLIEGTALLPSQVAGVLARRSNAVWVVPTAEFQMENYSRREWAQAIVQQCDNPEAAFENWMERDARFANWVIEQVRRSGLELVVVDEKRTIEENAVVIATHFDLSSNV